MPASSSTEINLARIACMRFRILSLSLALCSLSAVPISDHFDGRLWNISTGNLDVSYIQHSPIGAHPEPNYHEPLPTLDSQELMKSQGLVANEDYVAWGAVEREPGKWDWSQHDQ